MWVKYCFPLNYRFFFLRWWFFTTDTAFEFESWNEERKKFLITWNLIKINWVFYLLQQVGFLLMGVAVYGRAASIVTNLPIIGGILACGVFLILISILGLAGAVKHHQVMLFFVSFINRIPSVKCRHYCSHPIIDPNTNNNSSSRPQLGLIF